MSLDREDFFFKNGNGLPLARIQNTPGSWLNRIGRVTGVPKLSITDLRRAAEKQIQNDEQMKANAESLNFHKNEVGRVVYNQEYNMQMRGEYVNKIFIQEAGQNISSSSKELTQFEKDRLERKRQMELDDEKNRIANATLYLKEQQEKRNSSIVYSKRVRVLPVDRLFLQKLFSEQIFVTDRNFIQGIIKYYFFLFLSITF